MSWCHVVNAQCNRLGDRCDVYYTVYNKVRSTTYEYETTNDEVCVSNVYEQYTKNDQYVLQLLRPQAS